ncbi:MAG: hypothetical protein K2P86_08190 [Xanthobacteraceae bacterium]|nr:hypothetical protein [Xanthobacteraceae bacterium]
MLVDRYSSAGMRVRWSGAALSVQLRLQELIDALKANFDPNQPRDERGRWTDTGAESSGSSDTKLRNKIIVEAALLLARAAAKEAAFGPVLGTLLNLLDAAQILEEAYPYISAYLDSPKTLEELHAAAKFPERGYDIHHIVEQTPAERDGFPRSMIDSPENLVRIPTLKHWEINAWYQTKNKFYDFKSPRAYLQGKSWEERVRVGRDAMIRAGVLKR